VTSEQYSVADEAIDDVVKYVHGIRPNIGQFAQQMLQVFFALGASRIGGAQSRHPRRTSTALSRQRL